jgi:dihydrofolate reductase
MSLPKLGLIVASNDEGSIGYMNKLPWTLKGDLKNFKNLTMGQVVIMGRLTYESLPKALEGRVNIVVSSYPIGFYGDDDIEVVGSIEAAIEAAKRYNTEWIYFIGGAKIYEAAMSLIETAHVTLVYEPGIYDTYIDNLEFPVDKWDLVDIVHAPYEISPKTGFGKITHSYLTFNRKDGVK